MSQVVGAFHHVVAPFDEFGFSPLQFYPRAMRFLHSLPLVAGAAERIEDVTLRSRTEQRLGFVLAVKIHQRTAKG